MTPLVKAVFSLGLHLWQQALANHSGNLTHITVFIDTHHLAGLDISCWNKLTRNRPHTVLWFYSSLWKCQIAWGQHVNTSELGSELDGANGIHCYIFILNFRTGGTFEQFREIRVCSQGLFSLFATHIIYRYCCKRYLLNKIEFMMNYTKG